MIRSIGPLECLILIILLVGLVGITLIAVRLRGHGGGDYKKCPYCAERIRSEAIVCRYCGRDLDK